MSEQQAALPPMPSKTREILSVVYRFRQRWQHPTQDAAWWKACAREAEMLCERFNGDPFCKDLLADCVIDIMREKKGERTL